MAEGTEYNMTLTFPDAKAREDFETAFRGWLKEYQQRVTIGRALDAAGSEDDDTSGHLLRIIRSGKTDIYLNMI